MARACIPTGFAALVGCALHSRSASASSRAVQRLLHASSHDLVDVVLDPLVVNRNDIVQRSRCNLGHGGSFSLPWLRLATSSSARFGGRQPYLNVRKYVIPPPITPPRLAYQ